jgi:hypothetical protein
VAGLAAAIVLVAFVAVLRAFGAAAAQPESVGAAGDVASWSRRSA